MAPLPRAGHTAHRRPARSARPAPPPRPSAPAPPGAGPVRRFPGLDPWRIGPVARPALGGPGTAGRTAGERQLTGRPRAAGVRRPRRLRCADRQTRLWDLRRGRLQRCPRPFRLHAATGPRSRPSGPLAGAAGPVREIGLADLLAGRVKGPLEQLLQAERPSPTPPTGIAEAADLIQAMLPPARGIPEAVTSLGCPSCRPAAGRHGQRFSRPY